VWPDFATRENLLWDGPRLELTGTAVSATDSDADGLPDDWERFYFGDLVETAAGDGDGDGQTNHSEWLAGNDPTRPGSVLAAVSPTERGDGAVIVRFQHTAHRAYAIHWSEDLTNWQTVPDPVLTYREPGLAEWIDDGSLTGGVAAQRFYRVRLR
jgi:hypothetical protein